MYIAITKLVCVCVEYVHCYNKACIAYVYACGCLREYMCIANTPACVCTCLVLCMHLDVYVNRCALLKQSVYVHMLSMCMLVDVCVIICMWTWT